MATLSTDTQIIKHQVNWKEFFLLSTKLANSIDWTKYDSIYPIIRGGICVASELSSISNVPIAWELSQDKRSSTLIVDDICDSGTTLEPFMHDGYDCAVLHYAGHGTPPTYYAEKSNEWIVYPWEESNEIIKTVARQIQYIGDNPGRAGVIETPDRVVKSWNELYRGYRDDPRKILSKQFDVTRSNASNEPVLLENIEFYSTCEHHLLPFFGTISIGYIPNQKVVGISKLARLVDCFSMRLQIQERLCEQIADAIQEELEPFGVYVKAKARHLCMIARGVSKQNAEMTSVAVRGEYEAIQKIMQ